MPKGKRKSYLKSLPEKDKFLTILFSLLAVYIPTLIAIFSILNRVNSRIRITEIKDPLLQSYSYLLFIPLFIIIANLFIILVCGAFELSTYYRKKITQNERRVLIFLRKEVLTGPASLVSNCLTWGILSLPLLFIVFNSKLASILLIFYLASTVFVLIGVVKNKGSFSDWIVHTFSSKGNDVCCRIIASFWAVVLLLSIIFVIFIAILFFSVRFDLSFDKERYFQGEDAYIQISPQGIILPAIRKVTYSTPPEELYYVKDSGFGGAPIYLKIESSNLKIYPYNSYLTITYDIAWKFFRKNLTKSEFVPVFNYTREDTYLRNSSENSTV